MMNMQGIQKVNAQVHIVIGPQHISVPFDNDAAAEREWKLITSMLEQRKEGDYKVIHHAQGAIWIDLGKVDGVTWVKEARVPVPMGGLPPGMIPSGMLRS